MSKIIASAEGLGRLVLRRTFIEYDGPKFFAAESDQGQLFLGLFVDEDDDSESFLYVPISDERLRAFNAGVISGRDAVGSSSSRAWLLQSFFDGRPSVALSRTISEVPEEWLPEADARLDVKREELDYLGVATKELGEPEILGLSVIGLYDLAQSQDHIITLSLWHGGECLWKQVKLDAQVALRRLSEAWPHLRWRDGIVGSLAAVPLNEIAGRVANRLDELPAPGRERLQEDLNHFMERHELSAILGVTNLDPVAIVKQGLLYCILTRSAISYVSAADVLSPLEELGDLLAGALDDINSQSSQAVVRHWRNRLQRDRGTVIELVTGLSRVEIATVEKKIGRDLWASGLGDPATSEILAAARMSAVLPPVEIAKIVALVADQPSVQTARLNEFADRVAAKFPRPEHAWEHGLQVAQWLRSELGIMPTVPVDPAEVLLSFGVQSVNADLPDEVDALATWGPSHGPVVLINSRLASRKDRARRRVTLSHELGHLLLDRNGALPIVDVLRGREDGAVEARARAFAVELLLPQEVAYDEILSAGGEIDKAIKSLTKRYGVGAEIAAWQARNHGGLSSAVLVELRNLVGKPWRFY